MIGDQEKSTDQPMGQGADDERKSERLATPLLYFDLAAAIYSRIRLADQVRYSKAKGE